MTSSRIPRPLRSLLLLPLFLWACGDSPPAAAVDDDDGNGGSTPPPSNGDGDDDTRSPTPSSSDGDAGIDPPAPPCDPAQTAAMQANIETATDENINGVAFVKDPSCGERYFTRGPAKYPVTTAHPIASNTKMYTASLILLLADDGLLSLNDPISKWIDKVPGGNAITVRHALNHSSGIAEYATLTNLDFLARMATNAPFTPQELINYAFGQKVTFAPGAGFSYSNTNYIILGVIAEKVGGRPLEEQFRKRILEPIGAKSTWLRGKEELPITLAESPDALGHPSTFWAAGAIAATADDLGHWVEARHNGSFHSAAAQKELDTTIEVDSNTRYGAGTILITGGALGGKFPAYGHTGALPGYHSIAVYYPEEKTTVVVIADASPNTTHRDKILAGLLKPLFHL